MIPIPRLARRLWQDRETLGFHAEKAPQGRGV